MMTDPLADMLTRIRNANRIERALVDMPASKLKVAVAQVLQDEGYIVNFQTGFSGLDDHGQPEFTPEEDLSKSKVILRIRLKYGPEGEKVIRRIERASRPGRRLYAGKKQLRPVLDGLGISILSTNRGVMSDRKARVQGVGGEVLCTVW